MGRPSLSICALLAVRDEGPRLRFLLPQLARLGVEVAILDNGSRDETPDLIAQHRSAPIVATQRVPFSGHLDLAELLKAKYALAEGLRHDWLVHYDADEWLEHADPAKSLCDAIAEAEAGGHVAINFEEFVFLPQPGEDWTGCDPLANARRYYFFAPSPHRLQRAWRRNRVRPDPAGAGHRLGVPADRIAPVSHTLRHFMVLSQEHAYTKYLHRTHHPAAVARGWHGNRLKFSRANLTLPASSPWLRQAAGGPLDRSRPCPLHFWQWPDAATA